MNNAPDAYDDDVTYPRTLRLTVGTADEVFDRVLETVDEEAKEAVRTFEAASELRELLTDRRLELMQSIMAASPASITALADRLERNYADVHADVELLAAHRIVYFERDGQAKRPIIPYETIEFDVTITAADSGPSTDHASV